MLYVEKTKYYLIKCNKMIKYYIIYNTIFSIKLSYISSVLFIVILQYIYNYNIMSYNTGIPLLQQISNYVKIHVCFYHWCRNVDQMCFECLYQWQKLLSSCQSTEVVFYRMQCQKNEHEVVNSILYCKLNWCWYGVRFLTIITNNSK